MVSGWGGNSKNFPLCFPEGAEEEKMETEAEGQQAEKVSLGLLAGGFWHLNPEFPSFRVPVGQGTVVLVVSTGTVSSIHRASSR